MNLKKIALFSAKIILTAVIVYYISRAIIANWEEIRGYDWSLDPLLLTLSCVFFILGYASLPWVWRKLIHYLGFELSFGNAWDIFFVGSLGRYLPGKVWAIAGMAYMAEKEGIPAAIAGTSVVMAQAYSLLSSVVFFIIFIIFRGVQTTETWLLWFLPFGIVLAVVFLFPRNLERALNIVLRLTGREPITFRITPLTALKMIGWYTLTWLIYGIAFWLFVSAITGPGVFHPVFATGVYVISNVVGFMAFVMPAGIGVREGIIGYLLMNSVSVGVGLVIAGLSRFIMTIIEIVLSLSGLLRRGYFYGKEKKTAGE